MEEEVTKKTRRTARLAGVLVAASVILAVVLVWREGAAGRKAPSLSPPYSYDMASLREVDPTLIRYEESGRIETGFAKAGGLALRPDGTLWVAGDHAVRSFAPDGTKLAEIELAGAAHCVALAEDGAVYVGVEDHVEVFDAKGKRVAKWKSFGADAHVTSLGLLSKEVFAADSGQRVVWRCDRTGKVLGRIGRRNKARNIPGLVVPSPYLDLAPGRDGLLYVSNPGRHRLEAYTAAGDLERAVGKTSMRVDGFCGCCNPVAFALLPGAGFVTSEKGLARVKILNREGGLVSVVAAPDSFGEEAFGVDVAVDGAGRVYVLDSGARAVRIFRKKAAEVKSDGTDGGK